MSLERNVSNSPRSPAPADRGQTPSPVGLRHRPSMRTAFAGVKDNDGINRRSSFFSESLSETHRSLRTTTDDLFLPRVTTTMSHDDRIETSHWHSVPLGLALLPAVGGLFFKDGSHVITDVTLLAIAAVLLNWALRLPWEWYKAAQATANFDDEALITDSPIDEDNSSTFEGKGDDGAVASNANIDKPRNVSAVDNGKDEEFAAAQRELRIHELLALLACFVFPVFGAWLLHTIRGQLSRPSEGLVSNYNLTIFLLVAEIRPLSHLIKLVQRRTLFLQRKVSSKAFEEQQGEEKQDVVDITRRLEELEAHVADNAAAPTKATTQSTTSPDVLVSRAAAEASIELRKAFQPELDALNRAMRRYEKRMTITAIQVEARLQDLEIRLKDVIALAAAAQRNADRQPRRYTATLSNWISALVVVPTQYLYRLVSLPGRLLQRLVDSMKSILGLNYKAKGKDMNGAQRSSVSKPRAPQKKGKGSA